VDAAIRHRQGMCECGKPSALIGDKEQPVSRRIGRNRRTTQGSFIEPASAASLARGVSGHAATTTALSIAFSMVAVLLVGTADGVRVPDCLIVAVAIAATYRAFWIGVPTGARLRLTRFSYPFIGIVPAMALIPLFKWASILHGVTSIDAFGFGLAGVTSAALGQLIPAWWIHRERKPLRVAVVGSRQTFVDLARELAATDHSAVVIGYITGDDTGSSGCKHGDVHRLGSLETMTSVVVERNIDLLLVAPDAPRLPFFDRVSSECTAHHVRAMELSQFYETTFGHVPLTAINSAWFQYVMHPMYRLSTPPEKRACDLVGAAVGMVLVFPVVAFLALLIKRDGGPALYRQQRVGEGGRRFEILKLRSMLVEPSSAEERWTSQNDERVTPLGRFMRRTHTDELPQLLNVLRGDMSLVGPRPEQPAFVERLEQTLPFYSRRHMVRPGITGWAQVQCGYAGSDAGSALKLCHDLYYLKRRSLLLDIVIMIETVRVLFRDQQWPEEPISAGVS
jgi:exopolysaccharide biosynthesis polyprenyl glycosylphosphotransferase